MFKIPITYISNRISNLFPKEISEKADPFSNSALANRGFNDKIYYNSSSKNMNHKNRSENIIWIVLFSLNVMINIGKKFLPLLDKLFPMNHKYREIFLTGAQLKFIQLLPQYKEHYNS